jgi:hypothetical protein
VPREASTGGGGVGTEAEPRRLGHPPDARSNQVRASCVKNLMNWTVPTIAGIQRVAAILTIIAALTMLAVVSMPVAIGCLAGGALMIANLYVLVIAGKALVGLAQGGGVTRIGVVLAPLKLLILIGAVYLLVTRIRIDLLGFTIGSLTQLVAIFIETGRVSMRAAAVRPLNSGALPQDRGALPEDWGV